MLTAPGGGIAPAQGGGIDPAALFALAAGRPGLILAVSGGSDSMALMGLAALWRASGAPVPPIFVATVDHGLRPAAAQEAAAVAAAAARLGFPHETLVWEGEKPAAGVQAAARAARYRLLAACARRRGADAVVLGHHADDQAETTLMRLARGSGLAGLAGMAALAPAPGAPDIALLRPLLGLDRADLAQWRRGAGLPAMEDPSNDDPRFTRVRLRGLADILAREGLDRAGLLRLAGRAARANAALEAVYAQWRAGVEEAEAPDGGRRIAAGALAAAPQEFLVRLIAGAAAGGAAAPRLERAEAAAGALRRALAGGEKLRFTLGGVLFSLGPRWLRMSAAPPRGGAGPGGFSPSPEHLAKETAGRDRFRGPAALAPGPCAPRLDAAD